MLDFPAADAATYFVGQGVDVAIDGTFETTTGTIQSISGADSLSSDNLAVRSVVIAVSNPGTLNTTMSGTASINGVSAMSSAHFSPASMSRPSQPLPAAPSSQKTSRSVTL